MSSTTTRFRDRAAAGRALALACRAADLPHPVVLALPRGGVPVAATIADELGAPLDVLAVRKVGCPGDPEFGIGAVAEGGSRWLDEDVIRRLDLTHTEVQGAVDHAERELDAAVQRLRPQRPPIPLAERTALIVDDGVATGGTIEAAVRAARQRGATRIAVAVPVGAPEALRRLRSEADDVIALLEPIELGAIGWFYEDFSPVDDASVLELLDARRSGPIGEAAVRIPTGDGQELRGDLVIPAVPRGLVVFAHGSGSSRLSPRNRAVAHSLQQAGLATLLLDLLTADEDGDRQLVFDIPFLADRLGDAIRWATAAPATRALSLGLFGASTGAAAALVAAAAHPAQVAAVVSRGGRPDLAAAALDEVRAPTLLLIGGLDHEVLALNRSAQRHLRCPSELVVIPGATHLFEEPGALESVTQHATSWLLEHLEAPLP